MQKHKIIIASYIVLRTTVAVLLINDACIISREPSVEKTPPPYNDIYIH